MNQLAGYRGREIPWLPVVRFHKEVVARAEEGFFSLNGRDDQSDRWTSLAGFSPPDLAGPWTIPVKSLVSRAFRLALEQNQHETLFLGGPCYLGWSRPRQGGDWVPNWRPLLYREVAVVSDGDRIEIVPQQGSWNLTPLLYGVLDRMEVLADSPIDTLPATLVEVASTGNPARPIGERVLEALFSKVPGVEGEFTRQARDDTFRVAPTPWVLFAPTGSFSALTRHLMRDYVRMESLVSGDGANIGGLRLLEDNPATESDRQAEVLPVIPLNPSQRTAVETILYGRPLTVISGPPGTGKSQVVVALLLNAWAQGRTVLFASNNNKAVDVVRERVERFESEFPIAVRAGALQKQNIQDVLRRTLNMAGAAARKERGGRGGADVQRKREQLQHSRADLASALDSGLPQRIDESLRTALRAYGEYRTTLAEMAAAEQALKTEQESLGLGGQSPIQIRDAVRDTNAWLTRIEHYRALANEDRQRRAEVQASILDHERRRNGAVEGVGLLAADAGDWRWLLVGPSVDLAVDWERRLRELIGKPLEHDLEIVEWRNDYSRWVSAAEAEKWAGEARAFANAIVQAAAELAPKIALINERAKALGNGRARLAEMEIPETSMLPADALNDWLSAYAELSTREAERWDFLPWSQAGRLQARLKCCERRVRTGLPLAVLKRIGTLNIEGRHRLAPILEACRDWLALRIQWEATANLVQAVENTFRTFRSRAAILKLDPIPTEHDPAHWRPVFLQCEQLAGVADRAAAAWRRRMAKEETEGALRVIAKEWSALASGIPVREAWRRGQGKAFDEALRGLANLPDVDTLGRARAALYAGSLSRLIEAWKTAFEHESAGAALRATLLNLPDLADRARAWWAERPDAAFVLTNGTSTEWPDLAAAHRSVGDVAAWLGRWNDFVGKTRPAAETKAATEIKWALDRLQQAVAILPAGPDRDKAVALCDAVRLKPSLDWPAADLSACFAAFSPERIRARIERIEADLERSSFDDAKARWLTRLAEDTEAVRAVDALEKGLRQYRNEVAEKLYETFRTALRAVPIWITTAQAAQAIPLEPELFDIVVIDEASQCTLTNLLPLMYRGRTLAVIGDDNQLPAIPTIQSTEELALARKHGIEEHLALVGHATNDVYKAASESLPRRRADVVMLTEHFRSHPQIIGFSNRHIYQQRLELKKDPNWGARLPIGSGVHSVPVTGTAVRGPRDRSWWNKAEADAVIKLIAQLREGNARGLRIGVVTPFAAQKDHLRERLDEMRLASEILADTANGFQGDERDVMVFSPVVARGITTSASRWVESPPNLVNVALTRAREALFVVADFEYCLQQEGILRKLALYCKDIQLLRDTSPAELELFSWMVVKGWEPRIHPRIGDIEVDFIIESRTGERVAIEVDGQEFHQAKVEQDKARDAFLIGQGYFVERILAREVLETPFDVVHRIQQRLGI